MLHLTGAGGADGGDEAMERAGERRAEWRAARAGRRGAGAGGLVTNSVGPAPGASARAPRRGGARAWAGRGLLLLAGLAGASGLAPAFSESSALLSHGHHHQYARGLRGNDPSFVQCPTGTSGHRGRPVQAKTASSAPLERGQVLEAKGAHGAHGSSSKGLWQEDREGGSGRQVEAMLQGLNIGPLKAVDEAPEGAKGAGEGMVFANDASGGPTGKLELRGSHRGSRADIVSDEEEIVSHAISSWPKSAQQAGDFLSAVRLESAHAVMPHPLKAYRGGEDVQVEFSAGGHTVLGVFDGVGGWADLGVDPALYARKMGELIKEEFERDPDMCLREERPLINLLETAYDQLNLSELPGSCTVCLALLTSEGQLHVLNIGDSGLHVVRDGVSVFCTNEQQHYFNCPFQLGMGSDDLPSDGEYYVLEDMAEGDVIVAATDGMWDNVYEADMVKIVAANKARTAKDIATELGLLSHKHGHDPTYVSPFAANAAAQGLRFFGGKLDDVTVVVSRVSEVRTLDEVKQMRERAGALALESSTSVDSTESYST